MQLNVPAGETSIPRCRYYLFMTRVIRIAGPLIFSLLWACWLGSSALAQIEIDLGPSEMPALEAEEPEAVLGLAAQQMDRGDAAVALATIAQGLAKYPDDPRLLERRADIYATQQFLWDQAVYLYVRLLAQRPNDLTLKNKLANISLALRQLDQAEKLYHEVLAAAPDNAEAHFGLGRLYLRSGFYTLAQQHFDQALARMPDNQEAREGLMQARGLTTPQLQALAGHFEDSEGFRRNFLYSSYRLYLDPRLRLYGGYGYLSYSSGPALFPKSNLGRALHRHVLPLVLQYRPARTIFLEMGGALNDYARWGQSGTARASAYWQATPGTGLSLSYSYYDVIDFFGPFRGPWGLYWDDFSSYGRYRYVVTNPVGLWSQTFFGAVTTNTLAVTEKIRTHEGSFWGYQALGERVLLSGMGIFDSYNDGNTRSILGPGIQYRVLMDPLLKIKYLFAYGNYSRHAADLAPAGTAPAYADFHSLKYHSWGAVLEKNWGSRAKLVLESNFICQQQESNPWVKGVNVLAEMNYLLTYHLSLRAVGFYYYSVGVGRTYQVRSVTGGLSYRF
jgi:tetratricopeptide (TPR) repeat protein